ncbi:MAG: type III-A CRISPR-associated protein Csm2 [Magnetococcales bacterium]|nr:type III-A CRISPR-associated protein Csm2 [Magnetococcales bacterium]
MFDFKNPVPDLFDAQAQQVATRLSQEQRTNKPSQIRRFYDEICMWNERVNEDPKPEDRFKELLPFIRMLNAKAAYANGRNPQLVDKYFVDLMRGCLKEVNDPDSMKHFKLFMEAVMGFYKQIRPKD